ncbi:hypothetical protein BH10ACT11_BH10ACT11_01610 [soil metagenome]
MNRNHPRVGKSEGGRWQADFDDASPSSCSTPNRGNCSRPGIRRRARPILSTARRGSRTLTTPSTGSRSTSHRSGSPTVAPGWSWSRSATETGVAARRQGRASAARTTWSLAESSRIRPSWLCERRAGSCCEGPSSEGRESSGFDVAQRDHSASHRQLGQPYPLLVLSQLAYLEAVEQRPQVGLDRVDGKEDLVGDDLVRSRG